MKFLHRTAADVNEHVVHAGRCRVYRINPEADVTLGSITLRNGNAADASGTVMHVCALGMSQVGKDLEGVMFATGLTVQLGSAADRVGITWEALE